MTRNEQLEKWLSNRQRTYADGMELFNALAKANTKSSYGNYLSQAPENPHIFDPHFTQLVNILTKIAREIKDAPSVYPAAFEEILIVQTLNDEQRTQETDIRKEAIDRLQEEIDGLHNRISELESDTENHADELSALNEEFEEKMKELSAIQPAIAKAFGEGREVILESFIDGTEVTCGCYKVEGKEVVFPLTEVVTDNEFFDFDAKYNGQVDEITPARISAELTELIQRKTSRIYDILGAKGLIRVDYIIPADGEPVLLEINTTPGMTATSFIPQQVRAAGLDIKDVMTDIIEDELKNRKTK